MPRRPSAPSFTIQFTVFFTMVFTFPVVFHHTQVRLTLSFTFAFMILFTLFFTSKGAGSACRCCTVPSHTPNAAQATACRGVSTRVETMVAIANISLSGMGLYSYTPVEKGTEVSIEISFVSDKGVDRKDRIEGKIVWLSTQERLHFMGIAFDKEMNPSEQPFLYDYFRKVVTSKQDERVS